ncbi:MAG TPA: carbohydrate binding family 9 domain-containing protein, partial [Pyrinomonadaceae bacterium]|nr:carbohydrate binding family 9 domain-containing protein [Pyrinomonadaceae bacterium]
MSSATTFRRVSKSVAATLFVVCAALTADAKSIPTATPAPSPAASPASSPTDSPTAITPAPVKGRVVLPPEKSQPVNIGRFEKPPVIDGRLDDAVWQSASTFKNFYQTSPGDNTEPSKPTEVMMGYDSKTLYIAFHCFDDPDKVSASIAKRDDVLNGAEDSIRVLLDTFNDQRKAYVLAFNPLGVQMDGIRTEGVNVDFSVDIVMDSKGTITNDGYVVEVAIPFKSLRYEAGKGKLWGIQIFRIIQRLNGEQDSWMPISRDVNGLLNQAGKITGFDGISTERTLELIPSLTVSETGKLLSHFNPIPND